MLSIVLWIYLLWVLSTKLSNTKPKRMSYFFYRSFNNFIQPNVDFLPWVLSMNWVILNRKERHIFYIKFWTNGWDIRNFTRTQHRLTKTASVWKYYKMCVLKFELPLFKWLVDAVFPREGGDINWLITLVPNL